MRYFHLITLIASFAIAILVPTSLEAQERAKTVLVHYMPWYASKPISGQWGWHWTMNHFNPEVAAADGRREIASHDYPLIGPYDSGDDEALECQVLQMKFAGINGVVIDWYGTDNFRDYGLVHKNTQRLIEKIKKAKLQFAICYEDQSVKHMVENGHVAKSEETASATKALKWLSDHCFTAPEYVTSNGRPVLLVFGPQHFLKTELQGIASGLPTRPVLFGLPHLSKAAGMEGAFGWPPVTGGGEISPEVWKAYLKDLYARETFVSVAFPGFYDIYKEASLHESYGYIDDRDGRTFTETLSLAKNSKSKLIQIATWNDFGEGTMIEPTEKHGYRYLEELQKSFPQRNRFTVEDLRLPVRLYQLQKKLLSNALQVNELRLASDLLFAGKCGDAQRVLDAVEKASGKQR